jgi:SAM-dependent methyltransferase
VIALRCPSDGLELTTDADGDLVCANGHQYGVPDGIPVMLSPDVRPTQEGYWGTAPEVFPSEELDQPTGNEIDQYVRWLLRGTCGNMYDGLRVSSYPIPEVPLEGPGRLLDIGANWGRWSIAAERAGFDVVSTDPSLGAMRAARRVAKQLGAQLEVVVADGRHLPFPDQSFDVVFSYGVLQHLAPADVAEAVHEFARVLRPGGVSLHQLPNAWGPLSAYRQASRRFRTARKFEVRYWRSRDLRDLFGRAIGPTTLSADAFLTLSPHAGDVGQLDFLPRTIIRTSRALTRLSGRAPALRGVADSLWVRSIRR